MRASTPASEMSDGQQEMLEVLSRSQTAAHRDVLRAKALMLAGQGMTTTRIAQEVGVGPGTVTAWRVRFVEEGLSKFGRGPGWPRGDIDDPAVHRRRDPRPDTVQRVWSARGLKPHLVRTFKLSNDPHFEEKLIDVVGLYLDQPERAVVLCMDEKSSVQALDRTQPSLPMIKGRAETVTHDYKRKGSRPRR